MRSTRLLGLSVATLLFTAPAYAQDTVKPVLPPPNGTFLNIAATERVQVPQDLLIATLRIEKTGPDAKAVQNELNALMKTAMDKAKAVTGVKVSTGGYYVYEETPPATKEIPKPKKSWRGSQTLEIKGTVADDILKLSGDLQELGLAMNGLNYTLSPDKADAAKDELMEAALTKLKTRAERAAKAMGKSSTELVEVSVDSNDMVQAPRPMMMMAMAKGASADMAAPVAEPGETEITLTVSAKALLKP
ncbi:MAG: hypothetical protein JWO78_1167 [Micavibrio sp.]|nr:hypothetical protein [Micavibrio sp.]